MQWTKKTKRYTFFAFLSALLGLGACGEDRTHEYEALTVGRQWLYETMLENYLYYIDIPEKSSLNFFLAPDAFVRAASSTRDRKGTVYYSHVDSVEASSRGGTTTVNFGLTGSLISIGGSTAVRILYTEPSSPASDAGIQRGDWVIAVDGVTPTSSNYSMFFSHPVTAHRYTLGTYNTATSAFDTLRQVEIAAPRSVTTQPIHKYNTFTVGSQKVAYLMYNEFAQGDEADLDTYFTQIASYAPTDIILDLRYNTGGYLSVAQHLASVLATSAMDGKVFVSLTSNDKLNETTNYSFQKSQSSVSVLSYTRLFVITSSQTASASEALIHGLKPYLGSSLIQVGGNTFGKNVAQSLFTNAQYPLLRFWLTTHLVSNSEGDSSYTDGLLSDYSITENLSGELSESSLGTATDPMVAPIVTYISTGSFPAASASSRGAMIEGKEIFSSIALRPHALKR